MLPRSYFQMPPHGQRRLREFTISRDPLGYWRAQETQGLIGGVFVTHKDAVRFALREVEGDPTRVHDAPAMALQH